MEAIRIYLLETNCCRQKAFITDATDPDAALNCADECAQCTEDHHHGQNATATGEACRPITIIAMPGSVAGMTLTAPGSN
jgi:hypothetical protein